MAKRILVLGGGYAGVLAAQRISARGLGGIRVSLVSDRPHFTERIRLHERAAGAAPRRIPLAELVPRADVRVGRVEAIDLGRGEVRVDGGRIPFDLVITALGSRTHFRDVPGAREHAFAVGVEDEAERFVAEAPTGPLVVVGGGLTAVEMATELGERRGGITLVTASHLVPGHSERSRAYVREVLRDLGVAVRENSRVTGVERDAVHLEGGEAIPGRAIWCAGFEPTPLDGLPAGPLVVDATLRTSADPRIFGAGDQAHVPHVPYLRMGCAAAMPLGAHAADAVLSLLAGEEPEAFRFRYMLQCVSLGRRRGVVQSVGGDDTPRERIFRGQFAAWIKETICRYTRWSLRLERRLPGLYHWPRGPRLRPAASPDRLLLG